MFDWLKRISNRIEVHPNQHGHTRQEIRKRLDVRSSNSSLRDVVFGGIDGTVTTFAIVSGVTGAGFSSNVIFVLGVANLLADGFSMAAGNYSATRADLEKAQYLITVERNHLDNNQAGEKEELREILRRYGFSGKKLQSATRLLSSSEALWLDLMLIWEYGILADEPKPLISAVTTFLAFVICGSVPLLPFLLKLENPILTASVITGMTFFLVGAFKTLWTHRRWWVSGLETLSIGAIAAVIAFLCGEILSKLVA